MWDLGHAANKCCYKIYAKCEFLLELTVIQCDMCLCDYPKFWRLHLHPIALAYLFKTGQWLWSDGGWCNGWGGYTVWRVCAGWTVHLYSFSHSILNLWLLFCVCLCVRESVAVSGDVIVCSLVSVSCLLCMLLSSHHITPLSFSQTVILHLSFWLASSN